MSQNLETLVHPPPSLPPARASGGGPGGPRIEESAARRLVPALLAAGSERIEGVRVLGSDASPCTSTAASEVVTCRLRDGNVLRLFCKHSAGQQHESHGHRGSVEYEAQVYRDLLGRLPDAGPRCYGSGVDPETGETWLALEYLADAQRVARAPGGIEATAGWLGRFHRAAANLLSGPSLSRCRAYDAAYYQGWIARTLGFAGPLEDPMPWLKPLGEACEQLLPRLLAGETTLVHGEFYPANILVEGGRVCPVDWESAAVASGEIDLAALTEGWPEEAARTCEAIYRRERWPHGTPSGFQRRLEAARAYLHFRWLGDRPRWTAAPGSRWRFEQLRQMGERWGVL